MKTLKKHLQPLWWWGFVLWYRSGFAEISWTNEDPGMYRYNYNTYTNPNIDYVSSTCIGCENINQTSNVSLIDENPSTYQYNYNTYTNPNIDYITSDCFGCGYTTSGYTEPTYTYPIYTTPSYTTSGYSSGSYVDYNTYSSPRLDRVYRFNIL